jgi:D-serine deaminase-like pyridoxal phosphate-dependent protein
MPSHPNSGAAPQRTDTLPGVNPLSETDAVSGGHGEDLERLARATGELDPPFGLVDLEAFRSNERDLVRRAAGKPIRLASKSVRCRVLQQRVLSSDGWRGTLTFTLPEALWLATCGFEDLVVAYPTVHRAALRELARRETRSITIMVDSVEQLDFVDGVVGPRSTPLRVCLDIDAGWWPLAGRVRIGAKRSPVHSPSQVTPLATEVVRREGWELVGLMAYEAQIAGVGDAPPGHPVRGLALRAIQSLSASELARRRAEIVGAVRGVAPLEFVNGGGTGSLEGTTGEAAVTEVTAGSGLYGPTLFDAYRGFRPRPAAMFALPVVRKPRSGVATVLGGGYLASGPGDKSRLPAPHLPTGLRLDRQEGAGEVQTPVLGRAADDLRVGDRVYFRHAKAGEMCERFDRLYLIEGDQVTEEVLTYRGEGHCFL